MYLLQADELMDSAGFYLRTGLATSPLNYMV